jgi:hypothetical protein
MPLTPGTADVLQTMAAPTVVQNATGAGAAITYNIVAVNEAGADGAPSPSFVTGANNAATANNTISWVAIPGASAYRVLKNGALLATLAAGVTSYTDSAGASGATYVAQTSNPIAPVPVANSVLDGGKPTYSAAKQGLVPAATPTDVFTIIGSASKIIRILRIEIVVTSTAATGAAIDVLLLRRSTADTGGTSTTTALIPHDNLDPPATSVVTSYTANPGALGTIIGVALRATKLMPTLATSTATDFPLPDRVFWDFGNRPGKGIVLRGVADTLAINLNSVSLAAGASMSIGVELTEE